MRHLVNIALAIFFPQTFLTTPSLLERRKETMKFYVRHRGPLRMCGNNFDFCLFHAHSHFYASGNQALDFTPCE